MNYLIISIIIILLFILFLLILHFCEVSVYMRFQNDNFILQKITIIKNKIKVKEEKLEKICSEIKMQDKKENFNPDFELSSKILEWKNLECEIEILTKSLNELIQEVN